MRLRVRPAADSPDVAAQACAHARALAERERWPLERLAALQQRAADRARAPRARATRRSTASGFATSPPGPVALADLPIMTKAEMMDRFDDLVVRPGACAATRCCASVEALRDDALLPRPATGS